MIAGKQALSGTRQSGFTLVELLLSITLMAMLLGFAYGGLRAATRATSTGQAVLEETGSMRAAHQFVRRQLNQMQPLAYAVGIDVNETPVMFEGSPDRVQFVAPMPGYLGQGGPQVQYLELVEGPAGKDLVFNHQLLQGYDPDYGMERDPILLLEGIEQAGFAYLVADREGYPEIWVDTWDTPDVLPLAIRFELDFVEGNAATWPLLLTGIRTDSGTPGPAPSTQSPYNAVQSLINRSKEPR